MKAFGLMLSFGLATVSVGAAAASAADTSMAAPDCATANATLASLITLPMSAVGTTASLDENYLRAMHMMSDRGMQMAKLERACGKDAKTKDMAMKMSHTMHDELMLLLSGGH
jgi:hypothetical protein